MYNKGRIGQRANDSESLTKLPRHFYEKQSPIPAIVSYDICELGTYVPLDDTAVDTAGGQTIVIKGTGFSPNATVQLDGSSIAVVTYLDPTRLSFTSPAKASGTYSLLVNNGNGRAALLVPGIVYSGAPTFQSPGAGSIGSFYEVSTINETITATSDSNITYAVTDGTLPSGITLSSAGVLSGTSPVDNATTTYSFTIKATDEEGQDAFRSYSLTINTDVVTWASPANNAVFELVQDQAIESVTLNASSAAGKTIVYSADLLPTGISLSGDTITGTPTIADETVSTILTATANDTNRSATRSISWSVVVSSDPFFNYTALLLTGDRSNRFWNQDVSSNAFTISITGDTKPTAFSPFAETDSGSAYFDGTGDSLTLDNNAALQMGTGDFTMECWVYSTISQSSNSGIFAKGGSTTGFGVNVTGTNLSIVGISLAATGAIPIGVWKHIAFVRNSGTAYLYVDGIQVDSVVDSTNLAETNVFRIGANRTAGAYFQGYISNMRVVKGSAVYTGNFTPPTSSLTAIENTSLLTLQTYVSDNNNWFTDLSSYGHPVTRSGNTSQGTFSPFSRTGWSNYFDGNGDCLTLSSSASLALTTNDFTIEFFIFISAATIPTNATIYDQRTGTNGVTVVRPVIELTSGNGYAWYVSAANRISSGTAPVKLNSWQHLVIARSGTNTKMFIDGVQVGSTYTDTNNYPAGEIFIGRANDGVSTRFFTGFISNFRMVIGTAVYTSNFTPLTAPLTAITNTALLTCQSNRFSDNSTNNFTITRVGDTSVQSFSPFAPTSVYSPTTVGGSAYFDGTGDYLDLPSNAAFTLGTGDFTIEGWIYVISGTTGTLYDSRVGSSTSISPVIYLNSGVLTYFVANNRINGPTLVLSSWHHIAVARQSGSTKMYLNGVQVGSTYADTNNYVIGPPKIGAGYTNVNLLNGYISSLRVIKGTAVYTNNFTPPTAPLTATNDTSLLLNFTNAGINDLTGKNIIETGGTAKITNLTKKYGSGSLTFNGTSDYVVMPYSPIFNLNSGAFCIECWVNFSTLSGNRMIFDTYTAASAGGGYQFYWRGTGTSMTFYANGVIVAQSSFTSHVTGTWYHVAVTRNTSGLVQIFINGTSYASATYTSAINMATTGKVSLGRQNSTGTNYLHGFIDDFRVTNGDPRYTSNFTPSQILRFK